jgi:hypothetical protein
MGRFVSTDPISFKSGDANLYRFVRNAPSNLTDPSGLLPEYPKNPPSNEKAAYVNELGLIPTLRWLPWIQTFGIDMYKYHSDLYLLVNPTDKGGAEWFGNASRHGAGMALTTTVFGAEAASHVGDIHEYTIMPPNPEAEMDSIVDQFNNEQARKLGEEVMNTDRFKTMSWDEVKDEIRRRVDIELMKNLFGKGGAFITDRNDPRIPGLRAEWQRRLDEFRERQKKQREQIDAKLHTLH